LQSQSSVSYDESLPATQLAEYRLTDFRKGFWLFDLFASTAAQLAEVVVLTAIFFGELGAPSLYIDPTSGWSKEAWKYDVQDMWDMWGSWGLFGLQDLCIVDARSILQAAGQNRAFWPQALHYFVPGHACLYSVCVACLSSKPCI